MIKNIKYSVLFLAIAFSVQAGEKPEKAPSFEYTGPSLLQQYNDWAGHSGYTYEQFCELMRKAQELKPQKGKAKKNLK